MLVEIFNVEHGACALVTTDNGRRIMVDAGHNATTGWYPGTALARRGISAIDCFINTNYDRDHVSGYGNLLQHVSVDTLFRNTSVSPQAIRQLKSEHGMDPGIADLVWSIENIFTGGPALDRDFGDASLKCYRNAPGLPPFDEENNLSLVVFIRCGDHKIIFPGDMEKAGWLRLLQNPLFVQELADVTFFVASHHGRENGYCKEVMDLCPNIRAVIISDKQKGHQSQETVDRYRTHASGIDYYGTMRRVLTTRRDGNIGIEMSGGWATVYLGVAA